MEIDLVYNWTEMDEIGTFLDYHCNKTGNYPLKDNLISKRATWRILK